MKIEKFVIRFRWLIIVLSLLLVIGSVVPMLKMEINPDLASYMPATMPATLNQKKVNEIFGEREPLLIIFEAEDVLNQSTLKRIKKLNQEFKRQKEFGQVISLFEIKNIRSESGAMLVDPVVKRIPKTDKKREELREAIRSNSLAYGLVVSEDFRYTMMLLDVIIGNQDKEVIDLVFSMLDKYPGDETVRVSGQLYLRTEANEKIARDFMILLPIGIILMLIFLWFSFREIKGVILPFSVVVISILVSMGLIPLIGWELSIIGVLIPIMMIAIANNYGVHFIAKYQELKILRPELSMGDLVAETTRYLIRPIVLTGLTTMVGIIGLVAHILIPAKQMGVVVTIGIGLALILSLTLIPAWMSMMKKGKNTPAMTQKRSLPLLDNLLKRAGEMNTTHPRRVILFFIVFVLISGLGLTRFRVASDFHNMMPKSHPFNEAIDIAGEHFGGTKSITVSFQGDIKDPGVLHALDRYELELEATPGVGSVTSLATIIKIMSKALNDPEEEGYDQIPDSRAAIAQYIELYTMSGDPED
ncbi:MAG: MMPL family transporter, partial [Bacteroidales bacterium]|nr:MMPL family transporter [Bacteroidales bacterium]